jgi:hypothetical protein
MISVDADADVDSAPSAAWVAEFVANTVAEFNAADSPGGPNSGLDGFGYPTAKDKLDILGEQYFVAMYGGANDAWNFIRRTGYPRTLQRSLADATESGIFPRTGTYPSSEISANPSIIQRGDNSTRVFWDTASGSGINFDY